MFPLMAQLESELRICRHEVYLFMRQHDPAWLEKAEAHVRKEKAPTPRARGGGGRQTAAAAAAEGEAWLQGQVEASVFARVLQDIEDRCLGCVRRVLQGEGWLARSWQQDGLLVEDMEGRQLRGGGGGGVPAVERLEAAMRKAEEAVRAQEDMEVGLLVKDFFDRPVEAVLQRMAGRGGRRPAVAEARGFQHYGAAIAAGGSADAYSKRAAAQLQLARYAEAAADATASLKLEPTLKAHWRAGQACFALHQFEAARAAFADAAKLEPSSRELKRWLRKCDAEVECATGAAPSVVMPPAAAPAPPLAPVTDSCKIRHEWYQSSTHMVPTALGP